MKPRTETPTINSTLEHFRHVAEGDIIDTSVISSPINNAPIVSPVGSVVSPDSSTGKPPTGVPPVATGSVFTGNVTGMGNAEPSPSLQNLSELGADPNPGFKR